MTTRLPTHRLRVALLDMFDSDAGTSGFRFAPYGVKAAMPYYTFSSVTMQPAAVKTYGTAEVTVQIDVWAETLKGGPKVISEMGDALLAAIPESLDIDGGVAERPRLFDAAELAGTDPAADTPLSHGVLRVTFSTRLTS